MKKITILDTTHFSGTERSYSYSLVLSLTSLLLMQTDSKIPLKKLRKSIPYMYTFRTRSSFESPASKSAILRTAQPKGRLYCTLQAFFFSPAPIRPAKQNTYLMHNSWKCVSKTTEGRQRAVQVSMVTGLHRQCQVSSLQIWSIFILH